MDLPGDILQRKLLPILAVEQAEDLLQTVKLLFGILCRVCGSLREIRIQLI